MQKGRQGKRFKKPVEYQNVSLPKPLINEIKDHIKDNDEYRSIAEFVKEAIRGRLHSQFIPYDSELMKLEKQLEKAESLGYKIERPQPKYSDKTLESMREDIKKMIKEEIDNIKK